MDFCKKLATCKALAAGNGGLSLNLSDD